VKILEVKTLTKYFGGVAALRDVSFDVPEKLICGFIGPNGAGKTTLFSVITGALPPSGGQVELRGSDITGLHSAALVKKGVARTHQIVRPFRAMSVIENVQLAVHYGRRSVSRPAEARQHAMEALELVGLDNKARQLASALSLGQQKRLEVARALATAPQLLLLDEICGGLTTSETKAMLNLLETIREGGTTIMYVEHDMKAIMSICDRITVLNFGQKLAEGKPEEIQNNPAVIEAYLGKSALFSETPNPEHAEGEGPLSPG
jgi:branched-chain amino acid transport system ATP-binding protein